jgi:peptide/nickel transport system permease protein
MNETQTALPQLKDSQFRKPFYSVWEDRRRFLRRLLWTRKSAGVGALVVVTFVFLAIAAPALAPHDPDKQDLTRRYEPPSAQSLAGTDNFGRDLLSRIIWGARISLLVGMVAVTISLSIGGLLGITAGYVGGILDQVICSLVETLMAFPLLLLALAIITVLGPGLLNLMFAIGIGSVPMFARVLRAEVFVAREREYVVAARAIGASHLRIILRHILPNILSSLIVLGTTRIATAVLTEASLSFLGLGIRPPTASWGVMVADGRAFLEQAPWLSLIPGFVIVITVLGFSVFGDGLRDALDVRAQ